ncbi:terminase family protein [Enterococcus faecalis]|jgi:PBSX family phage terminase large subunit|uniref:terminase large subunit domain-containing protein n=1 Tax=Enterococcus TaxID=1350 RepID=UPI0001F0B333|nr:terminase family protein [Enterococcus faecalis]EFU01104.1 putative phage terminase, large subunit, PBSX family [Enterococcus faecalis TX0043]DAM23151.1 MAG TPA: large terminase [Caudoviricetes sp.]ASE66461.2 terminase [Enterococcus faecalis]EGO5262740.1 terminase [Enterococcus faecalis]EGO6063442.1 terminase [Enterococcus faecalis]
MKMTELVLSPKYKRFLKYDTDVEFLEGTTAAGKTTVGAVKFLFKVAESDRKLHIISGLDLGTIEKNIIQSELGIIDIFGDLVTYHSKGNKDHSLPHLKYKTSKGEKIVYVLGYDNKARWKKVLGGQYGCLYIDEINIADMEYVREIFMRADYVMATLNPDDPELPIYHEYINHSRPLPEYENDAPREINDQLNQSPKAGWVHWFFGFSHNDGLTEKKKQKIISAVPTGTKLYKNKILGIRGRAEGLVFSNFEYKNNVITEQKAMSKNYVHFSCGVDTSYSAQSNDTISFIFQGITDVGELVILEEEVKNNKDENIPFSPSDVAANLIQFLDRCRKKWGFSRMVYVDNADQATITELNKLKRLKPNAYTIVGSDKRMKIIDRINLMLGWINSDGKAPIYLVVDTCNVHIHELNTYAYDGDQPEDKNDHTINASQYGFLPIREKIGYAYKKSDTKKKIKRIKELGL